MLSSISVSLNIIFRIIDIADRGHIISSITHRVWALVNNFFYPTNSQFLHPANRQVLHGQITDREIRQLPPNTTHLTIEDCSQLTLAGYAALSTLHSLRVLKMNKCSGLNDVESANMINKLPRGLKELGIDGINNLSDQYINTHSFPPGLTRLVLQPSENSSFQYFGSQLNILPTQLRNLQIYHSDIMNDNSIAQIRNRCPQLTFLHVSGANQLTDSAIHHLPPYLTNLGLSNIPQLTGSTFHQLRNSLISLGIAENDNLTITSLNLIPGHVKRIEITPTNNISQDAINNLGTQRRDCTIAFPYGYSPLH